MQERPPRSSRALSFGPQDLPAHAEDEIGPPDDRRIVVFAGLGWLRPATETRTPRRRLHHLMASVAEVLSDPNAAALVQIAHVAIVDARHVSLLRDAHLAMPRVLAIASESRDAAEALRSGADDAILTPFDYDELEARLERLLPRAESDGDLSCYPVLVRRRRREIFARGRRLDLRPAEYLLLEHLIQRQPHVVSSCQLLAEVFGTRAKSGTLRFHVCTLRKKLSLFEADVIHTVRCHGYFVAPLFES